MLSKLNAWKQKIIIFAGALGAPGLFLISFLDSSILSFPVINDLLLIQLSINAPSRMPLYAAAATFGSVLGCILLYYIARKGGEAFFEKNAGVHGPTVRHWVERNGFEGMLVAALLPPPTPFKVFVFAAGVFEVPVGSFTLAVFIARVLRYFTVGYLAIRYGHYALPYLAQHKLQVAIVVAVFVVVSYVLSRVVLRKRELAKHEG
ncbi:MAG TPA: VTT domain-containing protein [Candidatus Dormibacteraeota bacterium]|nr:VTT domain-containing protein [Candidatus Dormibacteraeota bacterium]